MLWMERECLEFCLIFLHLVYIYVSKIKEVFLLLPKVNFTIQPLMEFLTCRSPMVF